MVSTVWDAIGQLSFEQQVFFVFALLIAFGFEFINGFHDTASAVTTVIYTGTLRPNPAVLYSGICNFFGVLLGGTAVAFSIVNLLPVDLLIDSASTRAIVMVVSLLLAGVIWNLSTWWYGLPVSSSHTLIGSILQRRLSGPTSHAPPPPFCATSLAVACGRSTIALPTPVGPSQDFVGVPDAYLQQVD